MLLLPGIGNSLTTPAGVIRPIRSVPGSVNQRFPSDPAAMSRGELLLLMPIQNSVMTGVAPVVIRPIRSLLLSANQIFPSGPTAMPERPPPVRPAENSVSVPAGVMRPIADPSTNHRFPSGPATMSVGPFPLANSVIVGAAQAPEGTARNIVATSAEVTNVIPPAE
jgi:hypothetical protein